MVDDHSNHSKVLLHECFYWDCRKCDHRNIDYWVPRELSSKHIDRMRQKNKRIGQAVWFVESPKRVICASCGAGFQCLPFTAD